MMRTTHKGLGGWILLALLLGAGGAAAGTVSDEWAGRVRATLEGPDGTVADGDAFLLTTTAERLSSGGLFWWLYEGGTWSYDDDHGVVLTGTSLVASDFWFSRDEDVVDHWLTRPAGTHTFTLVVSDAFAHSRSAVAVSYDVTVGASIETVAVDIKPTSCPNPLHVKAKGRAVIPVAVLGSLDLDVEDLDPASVRLAGVAPLRWRVEDVAAPVTAREDACDCTTAGPDGFDDLTLKFSRAAIVAALGTVADGDVVVLTLEGTRHDGSSFEGRDCMVIRARR